MLETLIGLPEGTTGLRAVGRVSREDYTEVLEPLLDEARREDHGLRFLYQLGPDFEGFTVGAAWEDAKLGLRSMRFFDGCAIVSDINWVRRSSRLIAFPLPCPVRVFENQQLREAAEWLQSLPVSGPVSHRLLPDLGVIVVEVNRALRGQDFDALSLTADARIQAHGELQGLVIHTRAFPGWDDFGSFRRHIRFVSDHHRKIDKVALAADGRFMNLAARLGEHFAKAEVKTFGYDGLEAAVAWAGNGATPHSATITNSRFGDEKAAPDGGVSDQPSPSTSTPVA